MDKIRGEEPSKHRFGPVLETALDAVIIIDRAGQIVGWNSVAQETFGWTTEEAIGRTLTNLIIPLQHRDAHRSGLVRFQTTREAHVLNRRIEITALRKNGEEFPVELSITVAESGPDEVFIGFLRDISKRREAEHAAREQAAILAQLAEGVIVANVDGRLTLVNDAAARLHGVATLGVTPDQYSETYHLFTLDGQPYPPDDLPLARALRGETVEDARWRVQRPDGSAVLAIGSARPIFDSAGSQVAAVVTVRDDTAREAAERKIRESEARLRALTDNLPGGMVYQLYTGADGSDRRFLFVSQNCERLTGVAAEAVMQDPLAAYNLIHPADREKLEEAETAAIRKRSALDVQVRFIRTDGEERWCRILSAPREQADGSLIWDGLQIDITARINAEQALIELNANLESRVADRTAERNLLATLFETTDLMIMACDLDYNILAVNRANAKEFERVYGIRPNAGDNLLTLLSAQPTHREQVRTGWARALEGQEFSVVEEYGDSTRDRPYYAIIFRSLLDDSGHRIGAYQFVTDVTDRVLAEGQLLEAQEALRQSQKMEAMGQLTGGVAHDFNNLLTPIIGSLDMLIRKGLGDEREQRLIAGAMQSADRAKTLVQRLLAFARRQPLQTAAVDLSIMVGSMADLLESTLGPNVELRLEIEDELPPARADENQLEMALLNLAVNAMDAMPEGGVLTISATLRSATGDTSGDLAPGQYVCLSVADSGTGMDEETLQRAIEPFFSTKGIGKGTGLGLSMVHGLAAQLGGRLTLASELSQGTCVTVWLPISTERVAAQPQPLEQIAESQALRRALLVDDEILVLMSTADSLQELGYDVTEAVSGEQALQILEGSDEFDLLVTDHLMPGMSGIELARSARLMWPKLPILIASGYSDIEEIAPDLPRLIKPFRKADLAEQLDRMGV